MEGDNFSGFGVNLIAYIRAEMGLGSAARGLAMAMESADIPFNVSNFEHSNPAQHRDNSWRHKESDHSSYDFTILAVNPDNLSNAIAHTQQELVRDRYTIGYWFWELPEIPDAWLPSFSLVDEVWTGSRFVQDAISLKSPVPVFRVPIAVRLDPTDKFSRRNFALPERQFLFLSISDTHSELARKNPLGAVRAFKQAFPGDNKRVGLVVKISNVDSIHADHETMDQIRDEIEGHRNIYLLDRNMTREEIDALLALSNCFISLHRSEGFGLGSAEAMSLGKPVILTDWSGNTDYMTPHNSIAIDYQLVPLGKQYGPYPPDQLWAEPDLEKAAFWMKQLVKDPDFATRLGELGQETIRNEFSPEAVGRLIHARLSSLNEIRLAPLVIALKSDDRQLAAVTDPISSEPALPNASLTIYSAGHSGYSEDLALEIPYQAQRWSHLHIALEQGLGAQRLRLDPMKTPGLVDIAGLAIKSATSGEVLWKANGRGGGLESLASGGSAMKIPHPRLARFFSYGEDPQIHLPTITGPDFDGPLRLEIWLRLETHPQPIHDAMLELTHLNARATTQIGETKLLLEEKTRDCSAKEAQIQAYGLEIERARQELISKNDELKELKSLLELSRAELTLARDELTSAGARLNHAQRELIWAKEKISSQQHALKETAGETASIQNDLAIRNREMDEAREELAATTQELALVAGELAVLKSRLIDQQKVIEELRAKPFWETLNPLTRLRRYLQTKELLHKLESDLVSPNELDSHTFWLEHPTGPSIVGEKVTVSGWVVDPSGERIEGVEAVVNGENITGLHGLERADVGAAHGEGSDFLHSGFLIGLTLPIGLHQITLRYLTRSHGWTAFCSFQHEVQEPLG